MVCADVLWWPAVPAWNVGGCAQPGDRHRPHIYSLEGRHRRFTLAFAFGCLLSSAYGFLIGAWPFGFVEIIWCAFALRKFELRRRQPSPN